mgnify:CR=1 FL=1
MSDRVQLRSLGAGAAAEGINKSAAHLPLGRKEVVVWTTGPIFDLCGRYKGYQVTVRAGKELKTQIVEDPDAVFSELEAEGFEVIRYRNFLTTKVYVLRRRMSE